jgi:site-specific DNA-methyltransferase (adenine-specific)
LKEILTGDSYELLKTIAPGTFRTIVTSPRYNKGKDYRDAVSGIVADDSTTREDYLHEMAQMGRLLYDVAADDCVFFLNIGDDTAWPDRSWQVMKRYQGSGWKLAQPPIIWAKSFGGKGHFTPINKKSNTLNQMAEYIFVMVKNQKLYKLDRLAVGVPHADSSNAQRWDGGPIRCAGNIWHIPYETTGKMKKKGHECPFPMELPRRCIKLNCCKGPVLDPFAGVLTTARAADELGVNYVAIELVPSSVSTGLQMLESERHARA